MFFRSPVALLAVVLAFGAGLWLSMTSTREAREHTPTLASLENGTALQPPRALQPFSLVTATDTVFDNSDLLNRWTLVFFGFTHCPDICPATLQVLADTTRRLTAAGVETTPGVLLVTVDPARDDAATLANYVAHFGDNTVGATGTEGAIAALAADIGIVYRRVELDEGYTMDHSGAVLLLNPEGELAAVFSPPLNPAALARDLTALLNHGDAS
ncbi:MAG: SCO family protein [Pseudomonadota bacterium]